MPVHLAGPVHDLVELRAGRGRLDAIEIVLEHLAEIPSRLIQASFIRGGLDPAAALEACMIEPSPTTGT